MSRDMKPRKNYRATPHKKSRGNTLGGLFLGLVIGVVVAAVVVWMIYKTPPPFVNKGPVPTPAQTQTTPASSPAASGAASGAVSTPLTLSGKPGDPIPQNGEKPRFDFYKILPANGDAAPAPEAKPADAKPTEMKPSDTKVADVPKPPDATPKVEKETTLKESVYLQTGSFQSAADADSEKARLTLLGTNASVQQIMLQDKVWYRVRLGPFKKTEDVNHTRAELAKQGIDAHIVK